MKKFCYVFKSADPAFIGWEWELTDLMHDWLKPVFSADRPGPDPVVNVIFPKPEGWPAHEKRFNWDHDSMTIESLSVVIYTMDAYDLRRDVLPHDVAAEVLGCLGRIYQEQEEQRVKLEGVINALRESVKGLDLPHAATSLLSTYYPNSLSGDRAAQAVGALALETLSIQREVDRLASVPKLTDTVTEALATLKGLGYYDPDSPAYKAMTAAEKAASALSEVASQNPWIKEFKDTEDAVKKKEDATIKAMLDANPLLKAFVHRDMATFNPNIKAVLDANPGLQDIINQCPHCGREL
jgi:hypothetical protein